MKSYSRLVQGVGSGSDFSIVKAIGLFLRNGIGRLIPIMGIVFLSTSLAFSSDIFLSQNGAGGNSGADCADAHSANWFNTAGNWGPGANQIGSGTTVHLCGVFTAAAANTTMLTIQGSGASGSPITILFEPGAQLNSPAWSSNGAISLNSENYITIDGGTNGVIQNTANGSSLANQQMSSLIKQTASGNVHDIEIKNLTLNNNYVRIANTASDEGVADGSGALVISAAGSNIFIHNNTITNGGKGCIGVGGGPTNSSNWQIYSNTVSECVWGINAANTNSQTHNIYIHDNDISNNDQYWDTVTTNCGAGCPYFHNDPIFLYGNPTGLATGTYGYAYIYNNVIRGALGISTGFVFLSLTSDGPIYLFNNVFRPTSTYTGGPSNLACNSEGWIALQWQDVIEVHAYNNTFDASVACGNSSPSPYNYGTRATVSNATTLDWINNVMLNVSGHDILTTTTPHGSIAVSDYNDWFNIAAGATPQQAFKFGLWYYNYSQPAGCPAWTNSPAQNAACGYSGDPRPVAYDIHSVTGDPRLTAADTLGTGSSAIGLGQNLTTICTGQSMPGLGALCFDKSGVARPSGGSWDAGAYTYQISPEPPTNLTVISH